MPDAPFARRTAADVTEVHHKLLGWLAVAAAVGAFAFVVLGCAGGGDMRLSDEACVILPAVLLPFAAGPLLLIYGLGCWPALLSDASLIERHGVAPEALTGAAWRCAFRRAGFWAAFARGALVMAAALAVPFWLITGRLTLPVIAGVWLMQAGQLSARAWVIRRAAGAQIT